MKIKITKKIRSKIKIKRKKSSAGRNLNLALNLSHLLNPTLHLTLTFSAVAALPR